MLKIDEILKHFKSKEVYKNTIEYECKDSIENSLLLLEILQSIEDNMKHKNRIYDETGTEIINSKTYVIIHQSMDNECRNVIQRLKNRKIIKIDHKKKLFDCMDDYDHPRYYYYYEVDYPKFIKYKNEISDIFKLYTKIVDCINYNKPIPKFCEKKILQNY